MVSGIGHRIFLGGPKYVEPKAIRPVVLADLRALIALPPLRFPHGLTEVEVARTIYPNTRQVACFDTESHAAKPWSRDTFSFDPSMYAESVRRYGFHGLSYQSIVRRLRAEGHPHANNKRSIAHQGNGCTASAFSGACDASNMVHSRLDGLLMGTRPWSIDPDVPILWMRQGKTVQNIEAILYSQSGPLDISEQSNTTCDLKA